MLSPSVSLEQPRASTAAPATVVGQRSMPSGTPSPSPSLGQPRRVDLAPARRVGAAVAVVEHAVAVGVEDGLAAQHEAHAQR